MIVRPETTTLYPGTNAVFSPDEKYVLTGVGSTSKGGQGRLLFLSRTDLSVVKELGMESTPVKVVWHSKINQIVAGLSNGTISVLYSPETSTHGAKLLLSKGAPKRPTVEDMSDALAAPTIMTPHALPMFKDGDGIVKGTKRKREKDRLDPRKSRRPELPVTGPGRGGRVGASATQHIVQNLVRDTTRDEDVSDSLPGYVVVITFSLSQPREALLKYADRADVDPQWTAGEYHGIIFIGFRVSCCGVPIRESCRSGDRKTVYCCVYIDLPADVAALPVFFFFPAWRQNQPKPVFANVSEDEEES